MARTAATTRTAASSRTAASNRFAVRNDEYSLFYDGQSTTKVTIPYDSAYDVTGEGLTLSSTIRMASLPSETGREHEIIKHLKTTGGDVGFQMFIQDNGIGQIDTLRCELKGLSDTYLSGTDVPLRKGVWYDVLITYDGTNIKSYIDGVHRLTDDSTGDLVSNDADMVIGNQNDEKNYFHGNIKNARIWSVALTEQQIEDLHFNNIIPYKGDKTKLVFELELNEGTGTTPLDTSGNNNHGIASGTTWSTDTPSPIRGTT